MLRITPERMAAVYECLRAFAPFNRWRLPPAAEVEFVVAKTMRYRGSCAKYKRVAKYAVQISENRVGYLGNFMETMAHEMVHLYQEHHGISTPNAEHDAEFRRLGQHIARKFGWDPKSF